MKRKLEPFSRSSPRRHKHVYLHAAFEAGDRPTKLCIEHSVRRVLASRRR